MNKKLVSILSLALLVIGVEAQVRDAFEAANSAVSAAEQKEKVNKGRFSVQDQPHNTAIQAYKRQESHGDEQHQHQENKVRISHAMRLAESVKTSARPQP